MFLIEHARKSPPPPPESRLSDVGIESGMYGIRSGGDGLVGEDDWPAERFSSFARGHDRWWRHSSKAISFSSWSLSACRLDDSVRSDTRRTACCAQRSDSSSASAVSLPESSGDQRTPGGLLLRSGSFVRGKGLSDRFGQTQSRSERRQTASARQRLATGHCQG